MKSLLLLFLISLTAFAQHKATTIVQIHPASIIPLTGDYMAKEHEAIVATETLKIAAIKLYSGQKVDLKHAISDLKKRISTKNRRGTDLIEITADAKTKEMAVKMANAVTDAFIKRRSSAEKKQAEKSLKALDAELVAQNKLVVKYREDLTKLIQSYGIPYFDDENPSPDELTEVEMTKNAKSKLAQIKARQDEVRIRIKNLEKLEGDRLFVYALGLDIPMNKIGELYFKYQEARSEKLALFDQGLSHKHPRLKAVDNRIKKSRKKLDDEIDDLKKVFKTQLELVTLQVDRMSEIVDERGKDRIDLSLRQQNYTQAKEAYEQSRMMLREMKIKQQEARVLLETRRDPVTLHVRAK
jgi:uncharacterized protein involved in exopolysaccharide biosynthesis